MRFRVYDPEVGRDNPVEAKHRRLVRSQRNGVVDKDLKPNAKIRDELNEILNYGPTHELTSDEKDLLWKFRFYLTRDKRALTKFVKSVTWSDASESKAAVALLPQWTEIDVDDALELLDGLFIGATRAREMRDAMVISVVIAFPAAWALHGYGNHGLWISFLLFMVLRSLTLGVYAWRMQRKDQWFGA